MRLFYWLAFFVNRAKFEWVRGARDGFARPASAKEEQILAILRDGNYVVAIKTHRELFSSSLKDAKDAVDALINKHGITK